MAVSPAQAVDRLEAMHAEAVQAQRDALARFAAGGAPRTLRSAGAFTISNSAWCGSRVDQPRLPAAPG
jgi:hypothetical protein